MQNLQQHDPVSRLIYEFSKLPGIGEKSATRLAHYLLKQPLTQAHALSEAILQAKQKIQLCSQCFTFTDTDPCKICQDTERDASLICVVEKPSDVHTLERAGVHRGKYHVLHGVLSPLDGIGPDDLKIKELLARLDGVREVVLATNPSVEGEATALYLSRLIKPFQVKVTQLAYGLPVGGMIEYSDRQTIYRAMENRVEIA